jgi:hypothetical protein
MDGSMTSIFVKISIVLVGLGLVSALIFPPARIKHDVIYIGIAVLAALVFAAVDHFHLLP